MDTVVYGNVGKGLRDNLSVPMERCECPEHCPNVGGTPGTREHRSIPLTLALSVTAVLGVLILSILLCVVTQNLTQMGKRLENLSTELSQVAKTAGLGNGSCQLCPPWWVSAQGSCYIFSQGQAKWDKAQNHCLAAGAHLVIVGDPEEQDFLMEQVSAPAYWLGLKVVREAGKTQLYRWVDGTQLNYSYWDEGEPNDHKELEDCVHMRSSGRWNDMSCDNRYNWICEKKANC